MSVIDVVEWVAAKKLTILHPSVQGHQQGCCTYEQCKPKDRRFEQLSPYALVVDSCDATIDSFRGEPDPAKGAEEPNEGGPIKIVRPHEQHGMVYEDYDVDAHDALHVEAEWDPVLGHCATGFRLENGYILYDSRHNGKDDHHKVELVVFRDILATETVKVCHVELVGSLVCSLVDFNVGHNPRDAKSVDEYNCKKSINQVIRVRNSRHSVDTVGYPVYPDSTPHFEEVDDDEECRPMGVTTSVMEHQTPQVLELNDGIVSEGSSLITLFALNADTDVSTLDHVDVVETIAYPHDHLLIGQFTNHFRHLGFLSR